jgi:hypothetical protein
LTSGNIVGHTVGTRSTTRKESIMQAIQTKYFGPSNVRGSRIIAKASACSVSMPYDHALNPDGNHRAAALRLMAKMKWDCDAYGHIESGQLADGSYVHVMVGSAPGRVKAALGNLLQWSVGNRGSKTGNPYSVPEVREALKALHYAKHGHDSDDTGLLNAADEYRTKGE